MHLHHAKTLHKDVSAMQKRAEMKGSAKTLTKNIELMRAVMGTRGPWKRSIGLRAYHDELLFRLAKTRYQAHFH